jgi:hypothetical protein
VIAAGARRRWIALAALGALAAPPAAAGGEHRYAVVAGNDEGGPGTRPLLYATADARRIHDVLVHLGGVAAADAALLLDRSAGDLLGAVAAVSARAAQDRRAGARTALIVYFSGHAKDNVLRLGDSRLPIEELRGRLASSGADVTVAILDSCRSGVVTRTKGARHTPAFEVHTSDSEARGTVLLTSSSADEDAQESDEIRGSYFSYHLDSGLRGGADRSRDGRVTLAEAYDYAYGRTVADTADSAAGAQHPTFSYDLRGNGDLVLTEFARHEGLLVPAAAPAGTYYVGRGEFIAAEVVKPAGADQRIALPAGRYWVKRRLADRLRIGQIEVTAGQVATVEEARLRDAPFSDDPVKGAASGSLFALALAGSVQAFFDAPTRDGLFPPTALVGAELEVRDFFRRGWVVGADLAAGGARATLQRPGVALPFRFSEASLGASLFREWRLSGGSLSLLFGGRAALMLMSRTFDAPELPHQSFSTFSPGLLAGLRYRLWGGVAAVARARVHYLLYNVEENRSLGYWELAAAVAYDF